MRIDVHAHYLQPDFSDGMAHQPYVADAFKAVDAATFANDLYQDLVERSEGRFLAFGCLPLPHVDAAIEEGARCLDDLRMCGVTLGCSVPGRRRTTLAANRSCSCTRWALARR